jgi:branched-chain amino acid aminotransferase
MEKTEKIWVDGKLVAWDEAQVHILTHTLHYGLGAFEGIRCYKLADGRSAIFRLDEHIERLFDSAAICMLRVGYTEEQVRQACIDVVHANQVEETYLRPLVFMGYGAMGLGALDNPIVTAVVAYGWGAYLGAEGLRHGIRARVSSFTRMGVNAAMSKGKLTGQYVNSILAKREALAAGYDEAILLDAQGHVCEASGENIFLVKRGVLRTPPTSSAILAGVTRDSLIRIARDLGYSVEETVFTRDELWCADEVFLTGTAAEVTPVREVDDRSIGQGGVGPVTRRLQDAYFAVVRGAVPRYAGWLTLV